MKLTLTIKDYTGKPAYITKDTPEFVQKLLKGIESSGVIAEYFGNAAQFSLGYDPTQPERDPPPTPAKG